MIGASRVSMGAVRDSVDALFDTADAAALQADGEALLSFAALLDNERTLRLTLADPAMEPAAKGGLLQRLLEGKVPASALDLLTQIVSQRWSNDGDMVTAITEAGQSLLLISAEKSDRLDRVEEEIFRFGRIIDANPELQMALTDPALSGEAKSNIVSSLLDGKADPITIDLLKSATTELHGRPVNTVVGELSQLAAQRRGRVVAEVRTARPLTEEQTSRLEAALARIHNRDVQLNVTIDPSVIGGIEVRVGDEIVDGTLSTRIEAARRRLTH